MQGGILMGALFLISIICSIGVCRMIICGTSNKIDEMNKEINEKIHDKKKGVIS